MSAFMVSKRHIDLLVDVAYRGPNGVTIKPGYWYRPIFQNLQLGLEQLDDLGEMLVKENLSSIHYRYPDTLENPDSTPGPIAQYWLEPYSFEQPQRQLTAIEALKAVSCYEYQACEHPEWKESGAAKFCECLRHSLISVLPGYEDAPWEWQEEVEAT